MLNDATFSRHLSQAVANIRFVPVQAGAYAR
jgi:hypothetical protein